MSKFILLIEDIYYQQHLSNMLKKYKIIKIEPYVQYDNVVYTQSVFLLNGTNITSIEDTNMYLSDKVDSLPDNIKLFAYSNGVYRNKVDIPKNNLNCSIKANIVNNHSIKIGGFVYSTDADLNKFTVGEAVWIVVYMKGFKKVYH
jgi:hypothetical protein